MNAREWKDAMGDLIDGVEQQVSASAPKSATKLKELRSLLGSLRTAAARQHFESRLEEFLQSAPHLRDAARRHLTPIADAALQRSAKTLKEADQILTARKMTRHQHK